MSNKLTINDFSLWKSLAADYSIDVFFKPEYSKIFEANGDGVLNVAIYFISDDRFLIYPFLKREINNSQLFDIITPYGYSAYYINGDSSIVETFFEEFDLYCKKNNIVSEFMRFHLFQSNPSTYNGEVLKAHENLYVDTTQKIEEIYSKYHRSVRKNIRKSKETGCKVIIDEKGKYLNEFYRIYINTMERNNANSYYFFEKSFFEAFQQNLPKNISFMHVFYDGAIIATELVLYSKFYAYSFLGGTEEKYFKVRPNDYLKHEIINWACEKSLKKYVIGGGYSENDGIYNYKKKFTDSPELDFFVGRKIILRDFYYTLCEERMKEKKENREDFFSNDFFPLYRS